MFIALGLSAIALIGESDGPPAWRIFRGAIAPALATMTAFGLPLDMVMAAIYKSGEQGPARTRYSAIIRTEGVLLFILLAAWGLAIGSRLGFFATSESL